MVTSSFSFSFISSLISSLSSPVTLSVAEAMFSLLPVDMAASAAASLITLGSTALSLPY
jgi:hypothetical protein